MNASRIVKADKNQLNFEKVKGWGGQRRGAGRINLSHEVNHMKRQDVHLKTPLHLTLRLHDSLPSLRSKLLFKQFKKCIASAKELGLYVIHFSIQRNHIHLFCEAQSNRGLALGMRSLAGRFAKILRVEAASRDSSRRGSVFKGRYHLHVLKTPTQVKRALEYVLLNLSKHQKLIEYLDEFSSAGTFGRWKELLGDRYRSLLKTQAVAFAKATDDLDTILSSPRSWLAREGWARVA